jgi:hypothetical protein
MATMQRGIGSPINTARYGGGGGLGVNMASGGGGGGGGPTPAAAMMNARRRDPRWNLMGSKAYNDNQYKLTGHGKSVTEAINEGGNVQAWAPSTGVGPGTRGYRGSYDNPHFKTGRPSASNSGEYYSNRDAVLGNPLTMLQLTGPGRYNLMDSIIAETRGTRQGTDAYYADKALSEGGGDSDPPPTGSGPAVPVGFEDEDHMTYNIGDGQKGFLSKYDANSGYLRGGAQGSVDPIAIARAAALKEASGFRAVDGGVATGKTPPAPYDPDQFLGGGSGGHPFPPSVSPASAKGSSIIDKVRKTASKSKSESADPFTPSPWIWGILKRFGRDSATTIPKLYPSGAFGG